MVVDADGTKLGEMSVEEARKLARKRNLEVKLVHKANRSSDNPGPDVYRIVDANAERRKKEQVRATFTATAAMLTVHGEGGNDKQE